MDEINSIDEDAVIDNEVLLNDVIRQNKSVDFDQVAVFAMKNGEFAIWSTHNAEAMENMVDDALDALNDGEVMDPVDEE